MLEVLRNVAGMGWKIAWGLVVGFAVSAFVQAFVSKERVADALGEATPRSVALATGLGMASSSCSYAAAAMSRTLFGKGAHLVNATAFLFASTNLVLEVGLVIWTLMGWRFVAAEFFGGILLILVVAVLLKWVPPGGLFERARKRARAGAEGGHAHAHGSVAMPSPSRVLSREGLVAAGRYFLADWRMIGKDIALGVGIAGTLAALVPKGWWQTLFLSSGGGSLSFWVRLENVVVGPVLAIVSFVCSVGNIPLAAILWEGGISFGGVVAFIYADLVTLPMLLVYRRYYGTRAALVYGGYLLVTMIVVALVVEGVFEWTGLAPRAGTGAAAGTRDYFAWDYTTILNLLILPLGAGLAWLGRRRGSE